MTDLDAAKARAEATFKKKEQQAREGAEAWAEYNAQRRAIAERTERLRALRLAKEAAEKTAAAATAVPAGAPRPGRATKRSPAI